MWRPAFLGRPRPELTKKDYSDELQRSDLKGEIDEAVNEHSTERKRAKGSPHAMLARHGLKIAQQMEKRPEESAAN